MRQYRWKMDSFAKGIDPNEAIAELSRIENVYGAITPDNILTASEDFTALFHALFQWDDGQAAKQYRLQQARNIVNNIDIVVIGDGQPRQISVFEVVNVGDGRRYKHIESMDSNDVEFVKSGVKKTIQQLKIKLSLYQKFDETINHLDSALNTLG